MKSDPRLSRTALVIGDNPDEAGTLIELLTGEGFSVLSAESGVQGIDLLRRGIHPQLMVVDWMLAGDGAEDFLTYVRLERDLFTVPIVVVTGNPNPRLPIVPDAVFEKPIERERLREKIRILVPAT